jgi:hypothetical protein
MEVTRQILNVFGGASGLRVNYRKPTATPIRGGDGDEDGIRENLGYEIANFPIRYLGLQLALRPLTKAEWQPMINQVTNYIPAWQCGLIRGKTYPCKISNVGSCSSSTVSGRGNSLGT